MSRSIWRSLPSHWPAENAQVWVRTISGCHAPFKATFRPATQDFIPVMPESEGENIHGAPVPWYMISQWRDTSTDTSQDTV